MNLETIRSAVQRLSRLPAVQGAMVVDAGAGVPVVAELMHGMDGTAIAALAGSLYRRSARAAGAAEFGALNTLQLDAAAGHVIVAGHGDLLVAVVADFDAQLGLLRLEAHRIAEVLR